LPAIARGNRVKCNPDNGWFDIKGKNVFTKFIAELLPVQSAHGCPQEF
jgi:hypothetical protein